MTAVSFLHIYIYIYINQPCKVFLLYITMKWNIVNILQMLFKSTKKWCRVNENEAKQ